MNLRFDIAAGPTHSERKPRSYRWGRLLAGAGIPHNRIVDPTTEQEAGNRERSMKRRLLWRAFPLTCLAALAAASSVFAHFQVMLPSRDVVSDADEAAITIDIRFTHPMNDGPVMEMGRPQRFGVLVDGKHRDLKETLNEVKRDGKTAFTAALKLDTPGDHIFYIEPAPYWEAAEKKYIIHYAKVVVSAFGAEEGWDALVGLPVEIEPLVRPYGLWTGNTFRGIVRHNGKPVPFATVEVEYNNAGKKVGLPNDSFSTQVIKADANGVFCYTMSRAGWWGFAALVDGEKPLPDPQGRPAAVELGGLIWVQAVDMPAAKQ